MPQHKEENKFITELIESIKGLNTENISNKEAFDHVVQGFADKTNSIWFKNLKIINITKHSKLWWNKECQRELEKYRLLKRLKNWKNFKSTVKKTKHTFFDNKIQEIASINHSSCELMNWVKKYKLSVIEAIQYNGQLYIELDDL